MAPRSTHGREGLVTGGVDERHETLVALELGQHLVGTDVLRDAAGFALTDIRLTDHVEQTGLTVVDVAHDGDHRRTGLEVLFSAGVLAVGEVEAVEQLAILVLRADDLHDVSSFRRRAAPASRR